MQIKRLGLSGIVVLLIASGAADLRLAASGESAGGSEPDLNYRALQEQYESSNAWFSRTLAKKAVGHHKLLHFKLLLHETRLLLKERSAPTQAMIDGTLVWLKHCQADLRDWEPTELPKAYPLIATGNSVVPAPEGVERVFRGGKYTNAYVKAPEKGIPILARQSVGDEYLLKMRMIVNRLLRKIPQVREVLVRQRISIALVDWEWDGNAIRNNQYIQKVEGKIEHWGPLEEMIHAIEDRGFSMVNSDLIFELATAYKAAVRNKVFDPYGTLRGEDQLREFKVKASDFASPEFREQLYLSPKIVSSYVLSEYFALGVCSWHGNLYPDEYLLTTRKKIAEKDPLLDKVIRRYFIDDVWRCARNPDPDENEESQQP